MPNDKKIEEETARDTTQMLVVISIGVVMMLAVLVTVHFDALRQTRQEYAIESRLLLNQLNERMEFNSREVWDFNVWLARRNHYLENEYNILLSYNDSSMTTYVGMQERCLKDLYEAKLADADVNVMDNISSKCNAIGEVIDERLHELLEEKLEEALGG